MEQFTTLRLDGLALARKDNPSFGPRARLSVVAHEPLVYRVLDAGRLTRNADLVGIKRGVEQRARVRESRVVLR
jgi:hypothetical protein